MKTRSNMPLFVVECEDVKALSNAQIDLLRCGDYLVKKDASGEHAYKVTYKSDTGMCLTYYDASVIETQSYDKIDGVWTYNSEDKTPNLLEVQNVEDAPSGTIQDALGLDSNGDLVKGTISGGTKLYRHVLALTSSDFQYTNSGSLYYVSTESYPFDLSTNLPEGNGYCSMLTYSTGNKGAGLFYTGGASSGTLYYVNGSGQLASATITALTDTITPL